MSKEIERKFLVKNDSYKLYHPAINSTIYSIKQGYLNTDPDRTVRIRVEKSNHPEKSHIMQGYMTVKTRNIGMTRNEYEFLIDPYVATEMIENICEQVITKVRINQTHGSTIWSIDEFQDLNQGLILAEVELIDENQQVELPEWIGDEVTYDPRYYNSQLALQPYTTWN